MKYLWGIYMFLFLFFYVPICTEGFDVYYFFSILLVISITGFVKIIMDCEKKYRLTYDKVPKYEYWRETEFKNIEPIYAGYILNKERVNINGVIATIFLLEKKEVLNIEFIDNQYVVSINEKFTTEMYFKLKKYEQNILKLLFKSIRDKSKINLETQIKKFNNEHRYKIVLNEMYREIECYANKKFFKSGFLSEEDMITVNLFGVHLCNVMFGFLVVIFNFIYGFSIVAIINLLLYIVSVVLFVFGLTRRHINEEYYHEINLLYGLYVFLKENSALKEKELKYINLYDEFLLYAIGMGITDKIEIEFRQDDLDNDLILNIQVLTKNENVKEYNFFKKIIKDYFNEFWPLIFYTFIMLGFGIFIFVLDFREFSINLLIGLIVLIMPFFVIVFMLLRRIVKYKKIFIGDEMFYRMSDDNFL